MANPEVDIVIRFKDEEFWLKKLKSKFKKLKKVDIFLHGVDNNSSDCSRDIFEQFDNINLKGKTYQKIIDYKPGGALNAGANKGSCKYIIFLSAHCIPKSDDYVSHLFKALEEEDSNCAGAFGRQLPLACSGPQNTVDLLLTYPKEDRLFRRTPLFNNANSIVRRDVFHKYNFDENVSNIEDLIWAKQLQDVGYYLKYTSKAEVYHYHGIHQHELHSGSSRVSNSLQILLNSGWLKIDSPEFCDYRLMTLIYVFRNKETEILTEVSYGKNGQLCTARVDRREIDIGQFDYIVFSSKELEQNILSKYLFEVARLTSKVSRFTAKKTEHNLQQKLTKDTLIKEIKSENHQLFFISPDIYRGLENFL